jgi:exonuclease SbcC
VRLAARSTGRYQLRRTDDAESKRQRAGLTLAVIDRHTGEERSPKSLSGGETFYTSLALALGLADVVRAEAGGVELDTLFIDEGFGSLDAETLSKRGNSQSSNRTGISHDSPGRRWRSWSIARTISSYW